MRVSLSDKSKCTRQSDSRRVFWREIGARCHTSNRLYHTYIFRATVSSKFLPNLRGKGCPEISIFCLQSSHRRKSEFTKGTLTPLFSKKKRLPQKNKWTAISEAFTVTFLAYWRSQRCRARQHPTGP
ncbi:hypothetical protein TNCV_1441781 [Trichonephila clavipes]|uniref:Uncharacterized protein n=1 Tax=Trichonephila clavipes TaxID=2585209 RepID=A0A8X6RPN8_TRICX|nr:hypothetical protein TNCV_1441781 [Trichonephila clavipes]